MKKQGQIPFFVNDWRVSPLEGVLARGDEIVRLEPKAMEVLVYLVSRPGEVITREELEQDVWRGALVGYDAVTNTIIKLRKALQDDARQPRFIATIPKIGYQLIATITRPEDDQDSGANPAATSRISPESSIAARWKRLVPAMGSTGIVGAVLAIVLVSGLSWYWSDRGTERTGLPSIAVLPFENQSNDPKQQFLADGLTEDIITDLSRLSSVMVIASDASSTYKEKQVSPEKVGADLGVRYVLKGSIRQLGNEVRVNAQLVDTTTGFNAWALRYDGKINDVFSVQDEITRNIVEALAVKMTNQEKTRLAQRATDNLKAYDYFQEGQRVFSSRTRAAAEQAREAYQKAIELDPKYGRAYGAIAVTLGYDYLSGMTDTPIETLDRGLVLAEKAVALDDSTPQTYWALGWIYLMRKEYESAEKAVSQAIQIAPNYADGYGLLALIKMYLGQSEAAIKIATQGMKLNPYYSWQYLLTLGGAYYMHGEYDQAIGALEEAQSRNDNALHVKLLLAASYIKAGRPADAKWTIDRIEILSPSTTISSVDKALPIDSPAVKGMLLKDLRAAGLPE